MKFVDQTTFGVPGGNCFSACVASLLELPIVDVPYFMGDLDEKPNKWFARFTEWLLPRGYWPTYIERTDDGWRPPSKLLCILSGPTSRGVHSVVGQGEVVVWDPHPSHAGLDRIDDYTLIMPYDPARKR